MITDSPFSWKSIVLTLPGTLQTSEQFFKSSAKQTEPEVPPKKNIEFTLSG